LPGSRRARQIFGITDAQVHVDTTSFSVSGEYVQGETAGETAVLAITYGYSRDHRADLKQWMLALATTHDGEVPLFLQPLDGNSSDKVSRLSAITAIQTQLREAGEEVSVYVADNWVYSETNMKQLNQAGVRWVSRVSGTMTQAKTLIQEGSESWQQSEDETVHWFNRELELPQGRERWVVVYTQASLQRAQATLQRQVSKAQTTWEQKCWHLGNRRFACEADARAAAERELKEKPGWLDLHIDLVAHLQYAGKGHPRKDTSPVSHQWQIVATVSINQE
jgi:transposase